MTCCYRAWMRCGSFALMALAPACLAACGSSLHASKDANSVTSDPGFNEYAATHGIAALGGRGGADTERTADGLRLEHVDAATPVKLDGELGEWPPMAKADIIVHGDGSKATMTAALQYDDAKLYVAANVKDGSFAVGRDHVSLVLAIPQPGGGYAAVEVGLYAGKPGESAGTVRFDNRGAVPGAKIVEAPTPDGYAIEAAIPWAALPEARGTRVGIHGVTRYVTGDNVIATGPGDAAHPTAMPWVPSEPELALIEHLLAPKGLAKIAPVAEIVADLTGDGVRERIAVYEHYLTICGTSYLGGTGFFFRDLGGELVKLEVRDVSGRGRPDVIVRRRASVGNATREYIEVLSAMSAAEEPRMTFAHEIAVRQSDRRIDNAVRMARGEIDVTVEPTSGWDAASYNEPIANDVEPILFPWGAVRSQTWRWDGSHFAKKKEVAQKESTPTGPASLHARADDAPPTPPVRPPTRAPDPPTPKVSRGGDLSAAILDTYRADRGVPPALAPKADFRVNVAGDPRPERVVVLGRDIVVFGPGFKGGTGYVFMTLEQFADGADIKDVSVRDLTGDGWADVIVRGERRTSGHGAPVSSELMFVYVIQGDTIARVFGIETGREQRGKRIQGLVQFVPGASAKVFDVLAAPGRATGWTEKNYPWTQDPAGHGDVEPLILPWSDTKSVRYVWNGTRFAKSND